MGSRPGGQLRADHADGRSRASDAGGRSRASRAGGRPRTWCAPAPGRDARHAAKATTPNHETRSLHGSDRAAQMPGQRLPGRHRSAHGQEPSRPRRDPARRERRRRARLGGCRGQPRRGAALLHRERDQALRDRRGPAAAQRRPARARRPLRALPAARVDPGAACHGRCRSHERDHRPGTSSPTPRA
jgi:hypothetical protein